MKIGILTFHVAKNVGAQLQAFALLCTLKGMGHDVELIRYEPSYLKSPYSFFRNLRGKKNAFSFFVSLTQTLLFAHSWIRKHFHYSAFQKKYLTRSLTCFKSIKNLEKTDYNAFIVGSDQVWNPEITGGKIDDFYALNFKTKAKRISYAASFSSSHMNEENLMLLAQKLKSFDAVSARERSLKSILENKGVKSVSTVLDPTFLIDRNYWESVAGTRRLVKRKYVLLYQARGSKKAVWEYASAIAQKTGSIVVDASTLNILSLKNFYLLKNAMVFVSPLEFVNLIKYAEYIVTLSFHGTALSSIMHKNFTSLKLNDGRDERVIELLNELNLSNCLENIHDEPIVHNVDYANFDSNLRNSREQSFNFLKKALEDNVG